MDAIRKYLSHILDEYEASIGWGWFTRNSRKQTIHTLRVAIATNDDKSIAYTILHFASTMHDPNPDVGYMNQSKLHNLLWGNHGINAPHGGLYQMLFDYLLSPAGLRLSTGLTFNYNNQKLTLKDNKIQNREIIEKLIGYNWGKNHSLSRVSQWEPHSSCLHKGCTF